MEVVCACIFDKNRVLIAKRSSREYDGIWEFPGGKVEDNETCEEAVVREIKEELDVNIHHLHYLCSICDNTKDKPIHVHAYACEIYSGEIHLRAHSMMKWMEPENIDLSSFHRSDGPIIQACRDYLAK